MRLHVLPALATCALIMAFATPAKAAADYAIKLQTGDVIPQAQTDVAAATSNLSGKHVLVQFDYPITFDDRDRLASQGITILDYVPSNTWIARIDRPLSSGEVARMNVKWVGAIAPDQKISPLLTEFGIRETSKRGNGRAQFAIILQKDQDLAVWSERMKSDFNAEIIGTEPSVNKIDLILPEATYLDLAQLDEIQWIEQGQPEKIEYNNSARDNVGATVIQAAPYNLNGSGIMVALWDGGRAKSSHPDFSGRVVDIDGSAVAAHATHVAGTIVGDGTNSGGIYRGMAPGAQLMTQQWWNSASEAASEYQQATAFYQARTANNSWGYGVGDPATNSACNATLGNYFSEDATLDNIVRGDIGSPISIVYSAGNQRGSSTQYCGSIGWTFNTVDPLASSKNVISVGAINSNNSTMASFSSWGPTDDGRIKPDVVGPGCQSNDDHGVTSCATNNGYTVMCGTSMSGPVITGVVALMYQQQNISFPSTPILPSTIRGVLINTAIDLGPVGPDYQYGWGKVDAVTAVKKISAGTPSYVESQITQSTTQS
ncbi:MAG: S8 family serine peptidase, partial [Candidatus Zixiibacteriota bacterium]